MTRYRLAKSQLSKTTKAIQRCKPCNAYLCTFIFPKLGAKTLLDTRFSVILLGSLIPFIIGNMVAAEKALRAEEARAKSNA